MIEMGSSGIVRTGGSDGGGDGESSGGDSGGDKKQPPQVSAHVAFQ